MSARSNRAEVRNPVLLLPAVQALRRLDPEAMVALQRLLLEIRDEARLKANKSWHTHKPPVAAY